MQKEILVELLLQKKTLREMSKILGKSVTGIRYWLKKFQLKPTYSETKNKTWTDEEMKNAISSSETISDTLRKLNLKVRPGNYTTVKNFIIANNIDISHMTGKKCGRGKRESIPLSDMLTENSLYGRGDIKRRLLKEGLLKNVCYECGGHAEWRGKNLVMILDHVNGNNIDNRLENLRMLCPNCNSQQSTFCRNINRTKTIPKSQRGRCIDCDKPIYERSKRCNGCRSMHDRKVIRPNKEDLAQMISSMTWVDISKKHGVSAHTIKKWARQYGIVFAPRKTPTVVDL